MKTHRDTLVETVLAGQQSITSSAQSATAAYWLRLDLTMTQLKSVFALHRQGPMPVGGLAEALSVGLSAASILVDKLVQQALAERHEDPKDRRRTVVTLTPGAEQLVIQLRQGSSQFLRKLCSQMADDDLQALAQGVSALATIGRAQTRTGLSSDCQGKVLEREMDYKRVPRSKKR
jgi:DNA-binding MarR family transcriptional regulator